MSYSKVRNRRAFRGVVGLTVLSALAAAIYAAYRWAEPTPDAMRRAMLPGSGASATVRLDDTPFAGYLGGVRQWSLHAAQVTVVRQPNTSLSSIESATLTNIQDGAIYDARQMSGSPSALGPASYTASGVRAEVDAGRVAATFRADQGRYATGYAETPPADLNGLYSVQWLFRLTGNVVFRTRSNDTFSAPSITIYQLANRRSGKTEQRVLCEQGARLERESTVVTANSIRYNPNDRTVECVAGIRGQFQRNLVQAERAFWSLNDQTLRCPDIATGRINGMSFVAQGLTLNLKSRVHVGGRIHFDIPRDTLDRLQE